MTTVEIWLVDKTTKRIRISGHSGYDVYSKDIVCSAISTSVMLAVNIINDVCSEYIFNTDEENAIIDLEISKFNEFCDIVMRNLYLTLDEISKQYPKYLVIKKHFI